MEASTGTSPAIKAVTELDGAGGATAPEVLPASGIQVGGEVYQVAEFNGFKAIRAGKLIATVAHEVQALLAKVDEYVDEYRQTHSVTITRQEAVAQGMAHLVPDGQETAEYPASPSDEMKILHVAPEAMELIESQLIELMALAIVDNGALEQAAMSGDKAVSELLRQTGIRLLHRGRPAELMELVVAARDQMREEFEGQEGLMALFREITGEEQGQTDESETSTEESSESEERSETSQTKTPPSSESQPVPPSSPPSPTPPSSPSGPTTPPPAPSPTQPPGGTQTSERSGPVG